MADKQHNTHIGEQGKPCDGAQSEGTSSQSERARPVGQDDTQDMGAGDGKREEGIRDTQAATGDAFQPTNAMRRVLNAAVECDYKGSVASWCRAADVNRTRYYNWSYEHAGFDDWWQTQARRHFARCTPDVLDAMKRSAAGEKLPGAADRKLWLELFVADYMPRTKQEIDQTVQSFEDRLRELETTKQDTNTKPLKLVVKGSGSQNGDLSDDLTKGGAKVG